MADDIFPGAALVQLEEWGYPKGALRQPPPATLAYSVIHITGNSRLPSAEGEVAWRRNDPALQNSATFFVNRDGSVVQALGDPLRMDPWANGDVQAPDTSNPRIAAMVRDGVNANQRTVVAIENVGYEPGSSITPAQEASSARIVAYYHAKAGVPISRETVIGHYQLNSTGRPNCPGVEKSLLDRIVVLAAGAVTLPDTALPNPQEDEMAWLPLFKPVEPFIAVTTAGAVLYKGPGRDHPEHFTPPPGSRYHVVGTVDRSQDPTASASNSAGLWYLAGQPDYARPPGFFIAGSGIASREPLAAGSAALANQVAAARTAVDGAVQAAGALGQALTAAQASLR